MLQAINAIFALNYKVKISLALLWDFFASLVALALAFYIRLGVGDERIAANELALMLTHPFVTIAIFWSLGLYQQVTRYISGKAGYIMVLGLTLSACLLFVMEPFFGAFLPKSVPFIYLTFAFAAVSGVRLLIQGVSQANDYRYRDRCLIYGSTKSGIVLANMLKQENDLLPVAFVDQKTRNIGKQFGGLPVVDVKKIPQLVKKHSVKKILLAVPESDISRRKDLLNMLEPHALELLTVPNLGDILSGKKNIGELIEVDINELLGRAAVPPIEDLLGVNIRDKVVMVTGGGGSIGSEICRQVALLQPKKLIIFELSEFNLYQIEHELNSAYPGLEIVPLIGSAQDGYFVRSILSEYQVQTIYHTAAYKHVPIVEGNIIAGVKNNIFGTAEVAQAAAEYDVEKFVLVSTDKAVRLTNVMGATKRMAELFVQGIAKMNHQTEFAIVRFGNVLGSSGSVVPLFKRQIQGGGPLTITHPDIIRFFMTIPEAALLVIQAGAMGKSGEVFVLDMGQPVKIIDLAKKMAHLMGHRLRMDGEDGDIEVRFTGLRPGEKLYEELLIDDADTTTLHPQIMGTDERKLSFDEVLTLIDRMNLAIQEQNPREIKNILIGAPLAYQPKQQAS